MKKIKKTKNCVRKDHNYFDEGSMTHECHFPNQRRLGLHPQ